MSQASHNNPGDPPVHDAFALTPRRQELRAFSVDQIAFIARMEDAHSERTKQAGEAKAKIAAIRTRLDVADDCLNYNHTGSAKAILEMAEEEIKKAGAEIRAAIESLKQP